MRLGVHLPLADLGDGLPSAVDLNDYVVAARDLGFTTVAANDHLVWSHPWLDGTAALASVAASAGDMTLATSITLPVIRHPAVVAKTLTTLAALARGPVVGGLGPGSSRRDYEAVGIPFDERWTRFDEALPLVRALVRGEPAESGSSTPAGYDITPRPDPLRASGSRAGGPTDDSLRWLPRPTAGSPRRTTRLLTSTPRRAAASTPTCGDAGRSPDSFPDAVATAWLYVTESRQEAEHVLVDILAPTLKRDPEQLRHLPIGSAQHCSEALAAYAAAGAGEVLVWPVRDSLRQLELCASVTASI